MTRENLLPQEPRYCRSVRASHWPRFNITGEIVDGHDSVSIPKRRGFERTQMVDSPLLRYVPRRTDGTKLPSQFSNPWLKSLAERTGAPTEELKILAH